MEEVLEDHEHIPQASWSLRTDDENPREKPCCLTISQRTVHSQPRNLQPTPFNCPLKMLC